ncbi:MAG TPA: trigger factor [Cytophagaceae bacterium]|jgi:trigger factor|nr:trigger factor [Cytophagaceae bacterium]
MEIVLEKNNSTNAKLKVNLKEADYQQKIKEKLKEYGKKVTLKGFRAGKVPASLIDKMYGKSILVDEINNLLYESVNSYIKDHKLAIVGDPLPDADKTNDIDWDNQKDFEFVYDLGLVGDFAYELSDKVSVSKYNIMVEDKVLAETLNNLRKQYGKMTDGETCQEGDFVKGHLKEVNGIYDQETSIPLNRVSPKEISKFLNKKVGDKIEFVIEEAFEDPTYIEYVTGLKKEEAATKKGKFEFTILNIRHQEAAPLDQEFFDKIFGKDTVTTEEEFNDKLKATISENYQRESDALLINDIREYYINNTAIELPHEFIKRWLLTTNQGKITQEQIDKEFDSYLNELKWTLIKNKVAENNEIKVEHEEVTSKVRQMMLQQFGMTSVPEGMEDTFEKIVDNYLKENNGKNYVKMFEDAYNGKAAEFIKSKIKLVEKNVTVDEFKKAAKVA